MNTGFLCIAEYILIIKNIPTFYIDSIYEKINIYSK